MRDHNSWCLSSASESLLICSTKLRATARDSGEPKGKSAGLKFVAPSGSGFAFVLKELPVIRVPLTVGRCRTCCGFEPLRQCSVLCVCFQLCGGHPLEHLIQTYGLRSLYPFAP